MRTKLAFTLAPLALAVAAHAQSTAFTYQGLLKNGGQPASGLHDLRFRLFNAAAAGVQVGATQCVDNVTVTDGVFTTTIDFGQQFATTGARFLQVESRTDTGLTCATTTGFMVLLPRQALTATPLANHAKSAFALDAADGSPVNAVFIDNDGKVGIGTTTPGIPVPSIKLDVEGGSIRAGNAGDQADLFWLASERSWVFRQEGTGAAAALKLQSIGGGGNKNFIVQTNGFVGIGTTNPLFKLDVAGDVRAFDAQFNSITADTIRAGVSVFQGTSGTFNDSAVLIGRHQSSTSGTGVLGFASSNFGSGLIGVRGIALRGDANSFGVFANGRMGATGTKSFRIDHPEDPENRYLFHYSAESPEVINFYRGSTTLDAQGRAVVTLPSYFARINTNPSYQLTAVGAPMPMLHVSVRISEQTLHAGAFQAPGDAAPACWFGIDGGVPGGEVSWRVEAVRNDEFVRKNGAPVEIAKPDHERGTTDFKLQYAP